MQRLDFSDARHIVSRVSIGQEWSAVEELVGRSRGEAVHALLKRTNVDTLPLPAMTPWNNIAKMMSYGGQGKRMARMMMGRESDRIKNWWMNHLLNTKSPIHERMTLLWHNHFTSSFEKVEQPSIMTVQNKLLRDNALGNYATLLRKIARDPAMLVYLDGSLNKKGSPNENFARELLELFTLGRGHYQEHDVKAAAVAFTGWGADRHRGLFVYTPEDHDNKPVRFLGKWVKSGDEVIEILLKHPRTAENIAEKFWKEFVSYHTPPRDVIVRWGRKFRGSNYQIGTLLREVLMSDQFWDRRYRAGLIKSPVELVVGTLRTIPFARPNANELTHITKLLGQDLMDPPNVKGWPGGKNWIDTKTMLVRNSLLTRLTRTTSHSRHIEHRLPKTEGENIVKWLLPHDPALELPRAPGKLRMTRALILDPVYQLK